MTIEPRWEQELSVNRMEYDDLLSSLSSAVSPELCQLVMKMENTVSELSKLAAQSPGESKIPILCYCTSISSMYVRHANFAVDFR